MKAVYFIFATLGAFITIFANTTLLKTLVNAIKSVATQMSLLKTTTLAAKLAFVGLGTVLGAGVGALLTQLPSGIRAITGALLIFIPAIILATKGVAAFQSAWSLGLAAASIIAGIIAISSAVDSAIDDGGLVYGFANGGITDANLIMTHENGTREWIGKQGNSTAVVNDTQMSAVMGTAVRNGVLEALSYNTGSEEFTVIVQANLDGEKVYETTRKVARRHGEKFTKV